MVKLEGPSTTLTFLGVEIYTAKMEIRLPDKELHHICQKLTTWIGKKEGHKTPHPITCWSVAAC